MGNFINSNEEYIQKINEVLKQKKNATVNIINDKLTLSVFSMLEKNLSSVKEINLIIRDTHTVPQSDELWREFELDSNPNELLFNQYDIIEKNKLQHFAKAKSMYDFIKRHVNVRRILPRTNIGVNILIIDDDFMISGSSSLEISNKVTKEHKININFDTVMNQAMDKSQIVGARQTFERVWHSNEITADYKDELLTSLGYVYKEHSPEFLYYFSLNELFGNQLDYGVERFERDNDRFKKTKIWKMLYNFQKDCVFSAIQKINKYGGYMIADSVGLGKTFEALAVIKYYELIKQDSVLVLTPAKLYENWRSFRGDEEGSPFADEKFNYRIMFHTDLSRYSGESKTGHPLDRFDWSNYDLIVIDESHNFRNRTEKDDGYTRYQRLLQEVIIKGHNTKVLLLSATPVNNSLVDLKNQISLITADRDNAFEEYGIPSVAYTLARTSKMINLWDKNARKNKSELFDTLPSDFYKLLEMLTISRSRSHITNYYGSDEIGGFPERINPPDTFTPDIDSQGLLLKFKNTNVLLESLNLSVYTPMKFIKGEYKSYYREKSATKHNGKAIFFQDEREKIAKELHKVNLFKRLESSVFAFSETIRRLLERTDNYIEVLQNSADRELVAENDEIEDETTLDYKLEIKVSHLRKHDFLVELYQDKEILDGLYADLQHVLNESRDAKLEKLKEIVRDKIKNTPYNAENKKVLIFTAFADTADYLYASLESELLKLGVYTGTVSGSHPCRTNNGMKQQEFNAILRAFSPRSKGAKIDAEDEISVLIGTDCISEGQNLQDCDCVINYDIQWNPVSLIQRFGRIDRIGSTNARIKMINFFPNVELNEYLQLEKRVTKKLDQVALASTGDAENNPLSPEMHELNFRKRQLERLQKEVIDLEDANDSISLTDLNMNDYLYELSKYVKHVPEVKKVARGIYSVTEDKKGNRQGVIFCFKHRNDGDKPKSDSSLYPYYLIFMDNSGKVILGNANAREVLKYMRGVCYGKDQPSAELFSQFFNRTNNTKNMSCYSKLLNEAIASIQGEEDVKSEQTVFDFGGFNNLFAGETADDFELVSFLILE